MQEEVQCSAFMTHDSHMTHSWPMYELTFTAHEGSPYVYMAHVLTCPYVHMACWCLMLLFLEILSLPHVVLMLVCMCFSIKVTPWSRILGNPKAYWNFLDESLNGMLAKVARGVHYMTFYERIYPNMQLAQRLHHAQAKLLVEAWPQN